MTGISYGEWLRTATQLLQQAGIATARLDALVLSETVTSHDRGWLLAHPELRMSAAQIQVLTNVLKRRATHEPLAYIRGMAEFYGRNFVLTPSVLIPRPESETMIELLKDLWSNQRATFEYSNKALKSGKAQESNIQTISIADVGAGSGALGITAALELPEVRIELLEIDAEACKIAQMNVDFLTPGIPVIQSDLLAGTTTEYRALLCNLPYVPDGYTINAAAQHEPNEAIFAGHDGLDVYRQLFSQLANRVPKPLYILTEALLAQHTHLAALAEAHAYTSVTSRDFIQVFKVVS